MLIQSSLSPSSGSHRQSLPQLCCLCLFGLLAFLPMTVPLQDKNELCNLVDGKCFCTDTSATCTVGGLPAIPQVFSSEISELTINNNPFPVPVLQRSNISFYTGLKRLILKNCGIRRLEIGAFSDLRRLQFLDLTNNQIQFVQRFTFRGLNVKFLSLNKNRGIRFERDAFEEMKVERLSIENSELQEVDFNTFLPLNRSLTGLWLANNNLRTLDPRFERLCSHLQHFKIYNNPLRCGCQLRWLVGYLKRAHEVQKRPMSISASLPPKCATPLALSGRLIREIKPHELICDPPQMRNVEILVEEARRGRLLCKAEGYPTPAITWSRIYPTRKFIRKFPPPLVHYGSNARQINQATVDVTGRTNYEEYACVAKNDGGKTNLTVRLRWPEITTRPETRDVTNPGTTGGKLESKNSDGYREPQGSRTDNGDSTGVGRPPDRDRNDRRDRQSNNGVNYEDVTEQNYFFRKQFTLLELIGAVVGTFTGTLALFVLIYRFVKCSKKKDKKPTFSQYMYESAYSGSHEYDVPRIDHGSPPFVPPKPPGADGMEFLDYKTHRKLYNHV